MGIKDIIDRLRLPRLPQNLKFGFRIKFRVFHKILGILAIMVLLIALQGYLNLQNIDQMQAISGRVFLESNMSLVSMMEAKQNINNFRRDNAMFLAGLVPIGPDHYTFVMNISDLKISAAAKSDLNQISEMLKQPLQKEQFSQLNQHLIAIESEVDRLLEQARSKSITSMNLGHQFSKNSKQTTLVFLLISCAVAVGLGLLVAASISRPLKKTVLMIQEMTRGHLEMRLKIKSKDEIGMMAQSMDRFADDLQTKVIGTMSRIAAGDLTAEVVAQDEQDEIGPALRTTIEALRGLVDDVNMLSQAAIEGRYDLRADAGGYEGDYRLIVEGINATLDTIVSGIEYQNTEVTRLAENLQCLAKGDLNLDLNVADGNEYTRQAKENFTRINANLKQVKEALQGMVEDAAMLYQSALEGKLDIRADAYRHEGNYRKIIEGVNQTLDAVIVPLNEAIAVLGRIAVNDLTVPMVGEYHGMLKDFSATINMVRNNLSSVQELAVQVARGDISQLEEFYQLGGKRSENDMLLPSFIRMMETIKELVAEVNHLTQAAAVGNLEVRGNKDKFEGLYCSVVEGINLTLDSIGAPLGETIAVLDRMAENDYTLEMNQSYQGAFSQLAGAVNRVQNTLNEVLSNINQSAAQIASGSKQVADGSAQVSKGAAAQSSSIEELSSTITQIAAQTRENAVNANEANQLAISAKQIAEQGNEQMKGMLKAISEIQNSSFSISKIIKVIDEIAFQTNILALNAAVEAARAGQHGKGFAVVAEEVRNLAARSANAAKETTDMIENSIKKVKEGAGITESTAAALTKIVEGVTRTTGLVGNIAAASKEQATGITQINQGIEQVSRVVQTNTATAQESASTCQELSDQAEVLKQMVNRFKLKAEQSVNYDSAKIVTFGPDSNNLGYGKY